MTEQLPAGRRRAFVQAPVRPLDNDGVQVARLGTLLWTIATVVLAVNLPRLEAAGKGWWAWVGVAGVLLGVALTVWTLRRRGRGVQGTGLAAGQQSQE